MSRVHLHIGTAEVMCRVCLLDKKELLPGDEGLVQIRTEKPVVCDWNDRYVLRHYAPQATIGGGVVLEASAVRERRFQEETIRRLRELKSGVRGAVLEQFLLKTGFDVKALPAIAQELAITEKDAEIMAEFLVNQDRARWLEEEGKRVLVHTRVVERAEELSVKTLREFHEQNPLRLGMKRAELRARLGMGVPLFDFVIKRLAVAGRLVEDGERLRLPGHEIKLSGADKEIYERVAGVFAERMWQPPSLEEVFTGVESSRAQRVKIALLETGVLVDIGEGVVLHRDAVAEAERILRKIFARKTGADAGITASEFRQALDTTRKVVIPLLNHFDALGTTQRRGDVRFLRSNR